VRARARVTVRAKVRVSPDLTLALTSGGTESRSGQKNCIHSSRSMLPPLSASMESNRVRMYSWLGVG